MRRKGPAHLARSLVRGHAPQKSTEGGWLLLWGRSSGEEAGSFPKNFREKVADVNERVVMQLEDTLQATGLGDELKAVISQIYNTPVHGLTVALMFGSACPRVGRDRVGEAPSDPRGRAGHL